MHPVFGATVELERSPRDLPEFGATGTINDNGIGRIVANLIARRYGAPASLCRFGIHSASHSFVHWSQARMLFYNLRYAISSARME